LSGGLQPQEIRLGDAVVIAGLSPLPQSVRRGDALEVRVAWRAAGEPATRWTATVQLLDAGQRVIAQHDQVAGGAVPSDGWVAGEVREDRFQIRVPESAPPGDHTLIVALYNPEDGQRLATETGDRLVELAAVQVRP
jgi:hypothetical protein